MWLWQMAAPVQARLSILGCNSRIGLAQYWDNLSCSSPSILLSHLRPLTPPSLRDTESAIIADFVPLSPLMEQASQNSLSNSSLSHNTNSDQYKGSGSSHGVVHPPRPSSILDPNPPQSQPIRRTNSWWVRFAKVPLLE